MQKTKIEWADYTWNPVKGECPRKCWYCYMKGINRRFKRNPGVRLYNFELAKKFPQKPSRIFVGSTIDLFHKQIPSHWIQKIIYHIVAVDIDKKHTFIFLTKNPARYAEFDFPENCWLGVTVTNRKDIGRLDQLLFDKQGKNIIFASVEPLLEDIKAWQLNSLDWIILGALTGSKAKQYQPKKEWIDWIAIRAQNISLPIFLKDNLQKVWGKKLIQEFPN